jgi:oligoendopeptidase F
MDIKEDIKRIVNEHLSDKASPVFLKRAFTVIDESLDEKNELMSTARKISKMVELFIDKNLSKEIFKKLKHKIENPYSMKFSKTWSTG